MSAIGRDGDDGGGNIGGGNVGGGNIGGNAGGVEIHAFSELGVVGLGSDVVIWWELTHVKA